MRRNYDGFNFPLSGEVPIFCCSLVVTMNDKEIEASLKAEEALHKKMLKEVSASALAGEMETMAGEKIWDIKVAMFETRLNDAENVLQPLALKNVWAMSLYAESAVVKLMVGAKAPQEAEKAMEKIRMAVAQASVLQKKYKSKSVQRLEAMAMEAHAYLALCMFLVNDKSYVRAAYYVRKSWKRWDACQKMQRELEEQRNPVVVPEQLKGLIAFGVGFFYWGVSMIPPHLEFMVKLLGFDKGHPDSAPQLLTYASGVKECGKSIEASLLLYVMKFWFLDERVEAAALLEELKKVLPRSPLLYLLHGWQAMITEHNSQLALECFQKGRELAQVPQLKTMFLQQCAWAHFVREEWEPVCALVTEYLEQSKKEERDAGSYSSFTRGVALHMLGKHDECTASMQMCVQMAEGTNNWDSYAVSIARRYVEQGNKMDPLSLLFILAENANEAGRPEKALEYLKQIEEIKLEQKVSGNKDAVGCPLSDDDRNALVSYYRGCAYRQLKQVDQAKSSLIKAAGMHQKDLALEARRAIPYSLVVLGEISMRELGQLEAAGRFFAKAKAYDKKYLFAETLAFRLRSDMSALESRKKRTTQSAPALLEHNGNNNNNNN